MNTFNKIILENLNLNNENNVASVFNEYLISIDNKEKFEKYNKTFKPFDKKMLGKSGGIVGSIGDGKVMKYFEFNVKKKYFKEGVDNKCLKIVFPINELFINVIFNNLEKYVNKNNYKKLKKYNEHFIKLYDFGISDNKSYTISEKVGFMFNKKYITNFQDVFTNNYIPIMIELINKKQFELVKTLIDFLNDTFRKYFNLLLVLFKSLKLNHTDLKLANIFIRFKKNTNKKYNILRKHNICIDFIPLVSDLDKSVLIINNIKTIPYIFSFKKKTGYKLLSLKTNINNTLRFSCSINKFFCHTFKPYKYDILNLNVNILGTLFYHISKETELDKSDIYNLFEYYNLFLMKRLNINKKEYSILFDIIYNNKRKNYSSPRYDITINKICKKLSKKKV